MLDKEIAAVVSLYTCRPLRADWEGGTFETHFTGGHVPQSFKGNLTTSHKTKKFMFFKPLCPTMEVVD